MKAMRFIRLVLRLFYQEDILNDRADGQWAAAVEWIAELRKLGDLCRGDQGTCPLTGPAGERPDRQRLLP